MVHYIFTPWRDRRELLAVRQQLYPRAASSFAAVFSGTGAPESNAVRRDAVARITIWMQRGFCPHMVESTALLTAAILADLSSAASSPSIPVAARAAYASAFARFVTGLLDGQQDRARKMSMHGLAQNMGLPAGFVELRHQITHEALPSLRRLRAASQQALAWIYDYYWAGVGDVQQEEEEQEREQEGEAGEQRSRTRKGEPGKKIADATAASTATATTTTTTATAPKTWTTANLDLAAVRASLARDRQALYSINAEKREEKKDDKEAMEVDAEVDAEEEEMPAKRPRWTRFEGAWTPRPIGIV